MASLGSTETPADDDMDREVDSELATTVVAGEGVVDVNEVLGERTMTNGATGSASCGASALLKNACNNETPLALFYRDLRRNLF